MGQDISQPSLQLQRSVSSKHTHNLSGSKVKSVHETKTLIIQSETEEYHVEISDDTMTCGWLLSETIRLLANNEIVALRSSKNLEALDCWLMKFDRNLMPFKNKEVLNPVYSTDPGFDIGPNSFVPIKYIGKGGFSNVIQARKRDTGELFAIKIMQKRLLLNEGKVDQILTERNILKEADSAFIVKLHWAYQTSEELHLVIDFCPGGELFYHLHNLGRFTEEQSRFYISEILLGLEYLHSKDIVYRDLKPENVLLDLDGHIKITDFGLSKQNISAYDLSSSFCGSPEYMSPEMLQGQGHGRAVDLYSLGALLYEMLVGVPPFYSQNRSAMYNNILKSELNIPSYVSKVCRDLLERLLNKVPEHRLGYQLGAKEVRQHPWFKGVSWGKVKSRKLIPPYRPNFRHSNFDSEYSKLFIDFERFRLSRIEGDPLFRGFEFNVKERMGNSPGKDSLCVSTDASRHESSVQGEECGATKVKLFMPITAPKKGEDGSGSSCKHKRVKEFSITNLIGNANLKTKNLVQELRPITSQRQNFRKGNKALSQDFIDLSGDNLLKNR